MSPTMGVSNRLIINILIPSDLLSIPAMVRIKVTSK
jgi:hypothetical protein